MHKNVIPFKSILFFSMLIILISYVWPAHTPFMQYTPPATALKEEQMVKGTWHESFEEKINMWIEEIQQNDPLFTHWEHATWNAYPFGPGSRQWVVILTMKEEEVGYLIVGDFNGLELIEYGFTTEPILSQQVENERINEDFVYLGLVWGRLEDGVLTDLITGERYEHVPYNRKQYYTQGFNAQSIQDVYIFNQSYDAIALYMGEYTIGKAPHHFREQGAYAFYGSIVPHVTGVFNIYAAHRWESSTSKDGNRRPPIHFLGIADLGLRFIALDTLKQFGEVQEID